MFSNKYIILYSAILVVLAITILSLAAWFLRPFYEENVKSEKIVVDVNTKAEIKEEINAEIINTNTLVVNEIEVVDSTDIIAAEQEIAKAKEKAEQEIAKAKELERQQEIEKPKSVKELTRYTAKFYPFRRQQQSQQEDSGRYRRMPDALLESQISTQENTSQE